MTTTPALARVELADAIAAALPNRKVPYKVIGMPREIDPPEVGRPVVMVIRTNLAPLKTVGAYVSDFAVWVIDPKTIDADDDLDVALDDVILALETIPGVLWTDAERSTYREANPAYRIACKTRSRKDTP